jgi:hypothetical protein
MHQTVWKFELNIVDEQTLMLPVGAQILSVQPQRTGQTEHTVMLWVLVTPDNARVERTFRIHGTGHDIEHAESEELRHISTFQMLEGAFIGHVFELVTLKDFDID